jgi:hypothetical protein
VGRHEFEIDQREKADRIVSPDRRDDPGDLRVSDRSVEVVDARLRMLGEEVRTGKGVRHLHNRNIERLLELALTDLVAVRDLAGPAPRERNGGEPIAGAQAWRLLEPA